MSMISEQVKRLRKIAMDVKTYPYISAQCTEAADVIEELSSKLQAANMERSSQYYNGGWIPCNEKLPEAGEYVGNVAKYYLVQNEYGDMLVARYTYSEYWEQIYQHKPYADEVVAWMPLPEPYKMCGGDNNEID